MVEAMKLDLTKFQKAPTFTQADLDILNIFNNGS